MTNGERALGLADLANVDAPEVVRTAVHRFRRRIFMWIVWIIGAAIVIPLVLSRSRATDLPYLVRFAPGVEIGATLDRPFVRTTVLDVRRAEQQLVVVHVLVTSDALRSGENLHVDDFGGGNIASAQQNGGKRFSEERGAGAVIEAWFAILPRTQTFEFRIFSATGDAFDNSVASAAQPKPDPVKLARRPGVIEQTFSIDLVALGVPDRIWR